MSNEGKACDAVIRMLEKRTGKTRTNLRRPEKSRDLPPVEVDLLLGGTHFAIEHTKLETFANQTYSATQFYDLVEEVRESLSGHLPKPGTYKLYFPTEATVGRTMSLERARAAIREWVSSKAEKLHSDHPERRGRNYQINTTVDAWTIWQLKNGDRIELSESYEEFQSAVLEDVTIDS